MRDDLQLPGAKHGIAVRIGQGHADDGILLMDCTGGESQPVVTGAVKESQHEPQIPHFFDAEEFTEPRLQLVLCHHGPAGTNARFVQRRMGLVEFIEFRFGGEPSELLQEFRRLPFLPAAIESPGPSFESLSRAEIAIDVYRQ